MDDTNNKALATDSEEGLWSNEIHKTAKKNVSDRFIHSRNWRERKKNAVNTDESEPIKQRTHTPQTYVNMLAKSLQNSPQSLRSFTLTCIHSETQRKKRLKNYFSLRKEDMKPFRKFKVVGWKDNYYTNLLDWAHNNFICAGYLNDFCLFNMQLDDDFQSSLSKKHSIGMNGEFLTSLKSSPFQNKVAMGYSNGSLKLFDYFKQKAVYNGYHHLMRIAAISWSDNLIVTGSKDQYLKLFDTRTQKPIDALCSIERAHNQQVCGIKQRGFLMASGGNDNKVVIYDLRKMKVLSTYNHQAAVKGLSWINDHQLVSGGGTADKKIKFWKDGEGVVKEVDTGSQVCSLGYSQNTNQIYSCQGFSLNQIILWSRQGQREFTFHGHSTRVLYSALSPSGEYLASGAGDQCLKIWKLFPKNVQKSKLSLREIR